MGQLQREDYFEDDLATEIQKIAQKPNQTILVLVPNLDIATRVNASIGSASGMITRTKTDIKYKNGTRVLFCSRPNHVRGFRADAVLDHYMADDKLWEAAVPCLLIKG